VANKKSDPLREILGPVDEAGMIPRARVDRFKRRFERVLKLEGERFADRVTQGIAALDAAGKKTQATVKRLLEVETDRMLQALQRKSKLPLNTRRPN
jgi:hypothetical protein